MNFFFSLRLVLYYITLALITRLFCSRRNLTHALTSTQGVFLARSMSRSFMYARRCRSLLGACGASPRYSSCNSTAFRNHSLGVTSAVVRTQCEHRSPGVAFRVFRTSVSPARIHEWPWHWPCQKHSLGGRECVCQVSSRSAQPFGRPYGT